MPVEPHIAFGIVLRRLRHERALTQEDLAYESGLARTFIAKLEGGRTQPTITTIFRLSAALGIEPAEIIAEVHREVGLTDQLKG
jgi:transcriptional regulator with XRE-family HTH domain